MLLLCPFMLYALIPTAHALPGWFAGGPGATLSSSAAHVVIARSPGFTTLTLAQDVSSNRRDFAMIVPVPSIPLEGDVREVSPDSLRTIDAYTAPRLVSYPCDAYVGQVVPPAGPLMAYTMLACEGDQSPRVAPDSGIGDDGVMVEETVTVAASYQTGVYTVQVLDAAEAGHLLAWLADNGYDVPDAAAEIIQAYLDEGNYFVAAKVRLPNLDPVWLAPLQITYAADTLTLPLRLGALAGRGQQELLMYIVTRAEWGGVGIANYPETTFEDECLVPEGQNFVDFYASSLKGGFGARPAWVREFAWAAGNCDPCAGAELGPRTVEDLGFEPGRLGSEFAVTRLRMRYDPAVIAEDLEFYVGGVFQPEQARFIRYHAGLTSTFPTCGIGYESVPGAECVPYGYESGCSDGSGLCSGGFALSLLAPAGLMLRRRRRA